MPVSKSQIESRLLAAFPDAKIELNDTVGDQNHYSLVIFSDVFIGKTTLQRHRMVNDAIADLLLGPLHAISIKAGTKNEDE